MTIYKGEHLKAAFKLLSLDISTCRHVIASPAPPGLIKYYKERVRTLEDIQAWLKANS